MASKLIVRKSQNYLSGYNPGNVDFAFKKSHGMKEASKDFLR